MTAAPDYGLAFGLWRDRAPEPWAAYTCHRFVKGLADGSLPRPAFLAYLKQDYVFLFHFARAWALAAAKSRNLRELRTAAATVDALVNQEMKLHVETCAAEGIPEDELFAACEAPGNLAYTRFVLEAGYSGDFLDLMAALAPCVFGYGEIGLRLAAEATDDAYRDWIAAYAGQDYQDVCRDVGALIDEALEAGLGTGFAATRRWEDLCRTFETATRLEAAFWEAGCGQP